MSLFFKISLYGTGLLLCSVFFSLRAITASDIISAYYGFMLLLLSTPFFFVKDTDDLFSPFFLFSIILIVVAIVTPSVFFEDFGYKQINRTLFYYAVLVLFFVLGFSFRSRYLKAKINMFLEVFPSAKGDISTKKVALFTFTALPLIYAIFGFAAHLSGINPFLRPLDFRLLMSSGGYEYASQSLIFLMVSALYINFFTNYRLSARNVFIFGTVFVIFFSLGRRGLFVLAILSFLLYRHNFVKKVNIFFLGLLAIALVPPFVIYGEARGLNSANLGDMFEAATSVMSGLSPRDLVKLSLGYIESFSYSVMFFDQYDLKYNTYHFLKPFFDFILQPVPRTLYPGKGYLISSEMTRVFLPGVFENRVGFDFGAVTEFYYMMGTPGIIIGSFFFGLFTRLIHDLYVSHRKNISFIFIYTQLMLLPVMWFKTGMINSFANTTFLLFLIPSFLLLKYLKKSPRVPVVKGGVTTAGVP